MLSNYSLNCLVALLWLSEVKPIGEIEADNNVLVLPKTLIDSGTDTAR